MWRVTLFQPLQFSLQLFVFDSQVIYHTPKIIHTTAIVCIRLVLLQRWRSCHIWVNLSLVGKGYMIMCTRAGLCQEIGLFICLACQYMSSHLNLGEGRPCSACEKATLGWLFARLNHLMGLVSELVSCSSEDSFVGTLLSGIGAVEFKEVWDIGCGPLTEGPCRRLTDRWAGGLRESVLVDGRFAELLSDEAIVW